MREGQGFLRRHSYRGGVSAAGDCRLRLTYQGKRQQIKLRLNANGGLSYCMLKVGNCTKSATAGKDRSLPSTL
jgi:hypothetical protein